MTRRSAVLLALCVLLTLLPVPPAQAGSDPTWELQGSGWGHGVGMSQYGAYGMALDGASAAEILDHYYSGAYLDDLADRTLPAWWSDPYPLVVGLSQGEAAVAVAAKGGPLTVCHRSGDTCAATHTVPAGQTWTVRTLDGDNEECRVDDGGGVTVSTGDCVIDVTWTDDGGNTRVAATGYEYAHGRLGLRPDSDEALNVVLTVDLEQYLRGVAEMPSLWPAAAQRAQAVAARNFAVRRVLDTSDTNGNPARSCDCHVLDSIYDQVYAGWSKESISPSGWLEAVEETAGRVAVHDSIGQVFTAYYSSSSGGATENNENAWGGPPIAYLRSVADPWAVEPDVDNPNASWSQSFTQSQLADILGWDTVVDVDLVEKPPGAVVRFTGVDGGAEVTRDFVGDDLRTTFGLKSPWVSTVISPYGMVDIATSVHAEDIQTLVEMGIAKGCNPPDNNRFCPTDQVTRGQMAAFMVRAVGMAAGEPGRFTDTSGSVFVDNIDALAAAGVTRGCNPPANDRYCPDDAITRGQMAAFLVRAFDIDVAGETVFSDVGDSQFGAEIAALATAGITKGCNPPDNTRYCPDDRVTREQMASFIVRAVRWADSSG